MPDEKAVAEKAAADKVEKEKNEAAQREADKKAIDDTAAKKAAVVEQAFQFHGAIGTPFSIDGVGFGAAVGQVLIGGRSVAPTRWNDTNIKGVVPTDLKPGPTAVAVNGKSITVTL
jgi:hypothetical protein